VRRPGAPRNRHHGYLRRFVWYFYRYTDAHNDTRPSIAKIAQYWFPIDQYIGGVEHAILHLIYSRFWTKFMRDMGLVTNDEPAERLFTQGMVIKERREDVQERSATSFRPMKWWPATAPMPRVSTALFAAPPDRDLDWQDSGIEGIQRFNLVLLLAPFAPYLAHELWEMLGEKGSLLKASWPKYDAALAKEEELKSRCRSTASCAAASLCPRTPERNCA
jgi:leucyl-tRNA synthetase